MKKSTWIPRSIKSVFTIDGAVFTAAIFDFIGWTLRLERKGYSHPNIYRPQSSAVSFWKLFQIRSKAPQEFCENRCGWVQLSVLQENSQRKYW